MDLESMWVHGLRRFGGETPVHVRFDAPLVCLVGANEVGKSTLLDALTMAAGRLGDDEEWIPIDRADWTRGETLPEDRVIVRLRYRLSKTERKLLLGLDSGKQLREVRWLERVLQANGTSEALLEPRPIRDKGPRQALAKRLRSVVDSDDWPSKDETEGTPADEATVADLLETLGSNLRDIKHHLDALVALADRLEEEGWSEDLVEQVRNVCELESKPHPHIEGRQLLEGLIPRFVRFEMADRELADEYDLTTAAAEPPPALHNLAELARLDLRKLLDEVQSGLTGSARATIDAANDVLRGAFGAWSQTPPVTVSFDRSGTSLLVHVQSGTAVPMKPGERSEGLRQFVALVALTAGEGHKVPPILLIDEVEMHLHYDAQADLMVTLAKQTTASQVVYTTHSSACLPEDLGSGVRVVRGVGEEMRSVVDQQFWSDDVGLVPLLLAMGAGSMAFVPLRPAVIAEGGSELVLLPSLMKEAAKVKRLGYQVVPGAAEAPPTRIAGLDLNGVTTVWVLDGDQGGTDRRKYLSRNRVPKDRIHLLRESTGGLDLEDLVHPATYVKAVNLYGADLGVDGGFTDAHLPKKPCERHNAAITWCLNQKIPTPSKTSIANKILLLRGEEPLLNPEHHKLLRDLHQTLRKQLKLR